MSEVGLETVLPLVESADEQQRLDGARRLALLATPEAIERLRLLGEADSSAAVRLYVRRALRLLDLEPSVSGDGGGRAAGPATRASRSSSPTGMFRAFSSTMKISPEMLPDGALRGEAPEESQEPPHPEEPVPLSRTQEERVQWVARRILRPCTRLLIENLEHDDLGVASEAARALGKLRASEATDRLLDVLRTGPADENVPLALGELGEARALGPLVRIFKERDQPDFKQAVVLAVAKLRTPEAEEFLESAIEHPDPGVRTAVVRAIGDTENVRMADFLLSRLDRVDEFLEMAIIQTLGRLVPGHQRVVERFAGLLRAEVNPRKLASLVRALARSRDPALVDTLEEYVSHRDRRVRANAVEAISSLDLSDPIKMRILRPLLADPDNRVRANACIALGRMGERAPMDTLVAMLGAEGRWHRASACYAIGVLRPPDGAEFLIRGLRDPDPTVRVNAARSLRELADPRAARTLIGAVNDRNLWIRLYAIEALGKMGVTAAAPRLRACLKQENNQQVLASAILAVARTSPPQESTRLIIDFLKHPDSRVRANAIEALELIGTREGLTRIATCLRDSDHRVRANAVKAIWKLGELRVVTTLYEMLSSPRAEERRSAAFALGEIGTLNAELMVTPNVGRLVAALQAHPDYSQQEGGVR